MKLYTEEQLHNTVIAISNYLDDINLDRAQEKIEKHLKALQPIELPSDEEIEQENPYVTNDEIIDFWAYKDGFVAGAKWMREQIQVGNK